MAIHVCVVVLIIVSDVTLRLGIFSGSLGQVLWDAFTYYTYTWPGKGTYAVSAHCGSVLSLFFCVLEMYVSVLHGAVIVDRYL